MKVAIIGTVGVPANYGGFETLVEQLIRNNNSEELKYTVYCSSKAYKHKMDEFKGATLKYVGLNANGIQSIPYDIISLIKATKECDVILILGVSGCIFLPLYRLFSNKKLIINIDGIEHKREKWSKWIRYFLRFSEKMAVKYGNIIIADNNGIAEYLKNTYGKKAYMIAYGGDQVLIDVVDSDRRSIMEKYDLKNHGYDLAISRIEPENNVATILEAYSHLPGHRLLFIGNWDNSTYGRRLLEKYSQYKNINMIPAVYELKTLNVLRSNCRLYLHGHSAGGTNPSLVEAMSFGVPIIAYDCIYNKESTEYKAEYFESTDSLIHLLSSEYNRLENAENMKSIASRRYLWSVIAREYEDLY